MIYTAKLKNEITMNVDYTNEKVKMQIEEDLNNLPKRMVRAIRKLKSEKGYTDNDILLHFGKIFRNALTIVCINISFLTYLRLFYFVHADVNDNRSLGSMYTSMSIDLYLYLIFMIVAVIFVINAFSIYKTKIIYKHVLDLQEIIEEGE
jgi:hypothetical protein